MPRKRSNDLSSSITRMTTQVLQLRNRLQQEIRSKEAELQKLKQQQASLATLAGGSRENGTQPRRRGPRRGASARIDWSNVLARLPKQFKASQIRKVRGLKDKRSSEIFAAITRWIEAGTVKRKDWGVYERVR